MNPSVIFFCENLLAYLICGDIRLDLWDKGEFSVLPWVIKLQKVDKLTRSPGADTGFRGGSEL